MVILRDGWWGYLRSLIDDGHLIELTEGELKTLLVIMRHADRDGVAWPGPNLIAQRIGINPRNARRNVMKLVAKSFVLTPGDRTAGGRSKIAKRKLNLPGTNRVTERPGLSAVETGSQRGNKLGHTVTPELPIEEEEAIDETRRPHDNYNVKAFRASSGGAVDVVTRNGGRSRKAA